MSLIITLPSHDDSCGLIESGSSKLCSFRIPTRLGKMMPGKNETIPEPNITQLAGVAATSCMSKARKSVVSSWLLYNLMTHLWCQSSRSASNLWVLHILRIIKNILIDLMFQFHWKTHINIEFSDDKRLSIHSPTEIVEKALDLYI